MHSVVLHIVDDLCALYGRFFSLCSFLVLSMAFSFDFQIISRTDVPGISLVIAQNEDAFSYLTEEEDLAYLSDGSVPLATDNIGDFISDAEHAHLCSTLV